MKTKFTFLTLFLLLVIACKSYKPFTNKKDKKTNVALIKKKINLSTKEYDVLKKNDSALYAISNAIKGNVKSSLIERRIDSFVLKSYTQGEFLVILQLDSLFPNQKNPFELDRRKNAKHIGFNDLSKFKKFMTEGGLERKIDTLLGMKQKVKDSTKKKQN
ncbi:hypothetical protein [Kordia sp.]|uniref:hypothetical protein n=1 Tax=Kordia sp. TaxID=1965332 RepID=UPI003D2E5DD1